MCVYTYLFKEDDDASNEERADGRLCSGSQMFKEFRLAMAFLIRSDQCSPIGYKLSAPSTIVVDDCAKPMQLYEALKVNRRSSKASLVKLDFGTDSDGKI